MSAMPRATTKEALLTQAKVNYALIQSCLNELTVSELEGDFPFTALNRNVRDVLCHLHEWQNMLLQWYNIGMNGEKPSMPKEGYTWKETPALNRAIWQQYQNTNLQQASILLAKTHQEMLMLIEAHDDEQLFTKYYYQWTNTTTLGSYFISATASHYAWALKLLKKYQRALREK